jgi:hypothetical protein
VSKETKAERAVRQDYELTQFINVLRRAGNVVEEEVAFDMRPADSSQSPPIPRKWRIDVALPWCEVKKPGSKVWMEMVAIEVQGVGFSHGSRAGQKRDIEKNGELFAQGWTAVQVSRSMIADGTALDLLARRGIRVQPAESGTK